MIENRFEDEALNRWRREQIFARRRRCTEEIQAAVDCLRRAFLEVAEEDVAVGQAIHELMDCVGFGRWRVHELLWPHPVEEPKPEPEPVE